MLAGCSVHNPLFEVSSGAPDTSGATLGESSTGGPTGEPTGTTRADTGGPGPGTADPDSGEPDTTQGWQTATSVDPDTGSSADPGTGESGESGEPDTGSSSGDTGGAACGNGALEAGEECDDGNADDTDACTGLCTLAKCGDGFVGPGEACDLGKNNDIGPCTAACQLPVCGDGVANGGEVCDGGANNGVVLGGCSEDCSVIIPANALKIQMHMVVSGSLGGVNGVASGDELCQKSFGGGYKVLAADGVNRIASVDPHKGNGQKDWVLAAHRGYAGANGLVFITGAERLLGVRKQVPVGLLQPISNVSLAWTGLNKNWTSAEQNCVGWSTANAAHLGMVGSAAAADMGFVGGSTKVCSSTLAIYCVQQPG